MYNSQQTAACLSDIDNTSVGEEQNISNVSVNVQVSKIGWSCRVIIKSSIDLRVRDYIILQLHLYEIFKRIILFYSVVLKIWELILYIVHCL